MSDNTDPNSLVSAAKVPESGPSSKPSKTQILTHFKSLWEKGYLFHWCVITSALPLVTSAGRNLEYEYVSSVAWLLWIVLPLAGAFAPEGVVKRTPIALPSTGRRTVLLRLLWVCAISPLVLMIVPSILLFSGICPCSRTGFTFWSILQIYPALLFTHGAFYTIFLLRQQGQTRLAVSVRWLLLVFLIGAGIFLTLWFDPQKRMTHFAGAFIHGPIYDEFIAMDRGIILARQSHAMMGLAALLAILMGISRRSIIVVTGCLGLSLTFSIMSGTYPSTRHGHGALKEFLKEEMEGDGFVLHYRLERSTDDRAGEERVASGPSQMVKNLFQDAQFHVTELREIFGKTPRTVQIYLYPDAELKKLHFGGGATDVTDVVTPSIHITAAGWPHPTLRHELVHAMAAHLGYNGLGFHPNMAFTEGLAMALAPTEGTLSYDEGVANLIKTSKLPKMDALFSPLFWKESGNIAYTVSGSFLQFVIASYGIEGVKKLYSGTPWKQAFRVPTDEVIAKWQQKISFGVDPARLDLAAEQFFREPGVLQDRCPHSKADMKRDRTDGFFVRMRQPLGWDPEQDYWKWRLKVAPLDREAQLQSLKSVVSSLALARVPNRPALADYMAEAAKRKNWPPKHVEDVEFALLESDLARLLEDQPKSLTILNEVAPIAQSGRLSDGLVRAIFARLRIEQNIQGPRAMIWRKFVAGWRTDPPERGESEPWILTYLRVRRGDKGLTSTQSLQQLMAAGIDQDLPQTFRTEWYKILGDQFMKNGEFKAAKSSYEFATRNASPGRVQFLEENVRRAQFYADAHAPTKLGDNR